MFKSTLLLVSAIFAISSVNAESHTVHFVNNCGFGTPMLVDESSTVLSTGADYTSTGPLSAQAYLQTGPCAINGANCTNVGMNLSNIGFHSGPSVAGVLADPSSSFTVDTSFQYSGGCGGASCTAQSCLTFFSPTVCAVGDVDITVTFCG